MVEGRQEAAWAHTASLIALLINLHRDPKRSQPVKPEDFMPGEKPEEVSKFDVERFRLFVKAPA